MFWKLSKKSIIIPAELHEKLRQTCSATPPEEGTVVRVRTCSSNGSAQRFAALRRTLRAKNRNKNAVAAQAAQFMPS